MRKTAGIVAIAIGLYVLFNLGKQTVALLTADHRITQVEQRVHALKQETQAMKQKRDYYRSDAFIEREARDTLNLVKPGEIVVFMPSPTPEVSGVSMSQIPNWQKWWNLFFE